MQIPRFNYVVILAFCFICSSAMANSLGIHFHHVSPPTQVESLRDFNISSEVNALRQVKKKCDNVFRNSDGSDEAKAAAYKPYEDEKVKQFKNVWKRRRDQHAKSRVTVTLEVVCDANVQHAKVRIDSPGSHLKPVHYGYREICRCEPYKSCNFDLRFDRMENNGYSFVALSNPQWKPTGAPLAQWKHHWAIYLLQADFAFTDAHLNALANRDLEVLKDRIMMAL